MLVETLGLKRITLDNAVVVYEIYDKEEGVYEYYHNKGGVMEFMFGSGIEFSLEDLQALAERGYFDD